MADLCKNSLDTYKIIDKIGKGAYGEVFLVEDKKSGKRYAAKKIKTNYTFPNGVKAITLEIEAYSRVDDPAILKFYQYFPPNINSDNILDRYHTMILEYMPNGSLDKAISTKMSMTKKMIILFGIALGMEHLHSNKIIHRDLKPANILLDEHFYPKICDFGVSFVSDNEILKIRIKEVEGTFCYMAPEMIQQEPYSYKVDVYSFALIAYELLTGTLPYKNYNKKKLSEEVIQGIRPNLTYVNTFFHKLIRQCWSNDPIRRPTFDSIVYQLSLVAKKIPNLNIEKIVSYLHLFDHKPEIQDVICNIVDPFDKATDLLLSGIRYLEGIGVPKDQKEAATYFKMAGFGGNDEALLYYAEMCFNGVGVPVNREKALRLYKLLSDKGFPEASCLYGNAIYCGIGCIMDSKKGYYYLKLAADCDVVEAVYIIGCIHYKHGHLEEKKEAARYFHMAANQGHVKSMFKYAIMLIKGIGIPKNSKEAKIYYDNICKEDDIEANYFRGKLMLLGMPDESLKNNKKHQFEAIKYIEIAAKKGNIRANYIMGGLFYYGVFVSIDREKAAKYLKVAADKDYIKAVYLYITILLNHPNIRENVNLKYYQDKYNKLLYHLGFLHLPIEARHLFNVSKYIKKDEDYLSRTYTVLREDKSPLYFSSFRYFEQNDYEIAKSYAEIGDSIHMYNYAKMLKKGIATQKNRKEAFQYFKKAADQNDERSMYKYGMMLYKGDGVKQNKEEGIKYIKKAADLNLPKAQYRYGMILIEGDGIESNKQMGIKYIKKAADVFETNSMFVYGKMLLDGDGVEKNIEQGVKNIEAAAESCHHEALLQYGLMLFKGDKTPINKKKAYQCFHKLVEETRNETAMINMAYMLKNGDGIPVDKEKAIFYFRLLSEQGNTEAMYEYVKLSIKKKEPIFFLSKEGKKYLKISADSGNVKSMIMYAKVINYLSCKTDDKDSIILMEKEAIKYAKMAADLGDARGMFYYATFISLSIDLSFDSADRNTEIIKYMKKSGYKGFEKALFVLCNWLLTDVITIEKEEAEKYLKIILDTKNCDLIYSYLRFFSKGKRIGVDPKDKLKYFLKLSEQGNIKAILICISAYHEMKEAQSQKEKFINKLKNKADEGNIDAMFHCGALLFQGILITKNEKESVIYLKKAADRGNTEALFFYMNNIDHTNEKYMAKLKINADNGEPRAMLFYALMLDKKGIKIDEQYKYLEMAMKKDECEAYRIYGQKLLESNPKDEKGLNLIFIAAKSGNPCAMYRYGKLTLKNNENQSNVDKAIQYIKRAADLGCIDAALDYGAYLFEGLYVPKNNDEAGKYLKYAADNNIVFAMFLYGCLLMKKSADLGYITACVYYGYICLKIENFKESVRYFKIAADQGDDEGMLGYSRMLFEGKGIQMNTKESIKFLKKSADFGNYEAPYFYGMLLCDGLSVEKNYEEAAKFMKLSADRGYNKGAFIYGLMAFCGIGIPINKVMSKHYILIASKADKIYIDIFEVFINFIILGIDFIDIIYMTNHIINPRL